MQQQILIWLVQIFVERQIEKYGAKIDWNKVKADAAARIQSICSDSIFDAAASKIVFAIIDRISNFMASPDIAQYIENGQAVKAFQSIFQAAVQGSLLDLAKQYVSSQAPSAVQNVLNTVEDAVKATPVLSPGQKPA